MKIAINVSDWKDSGVRCLLGNVQIVGSGDGVMILDRVDRDAVDLLALAGVGVEQVMTYPRSQIAN
jgi:hypothetical protein